ncbi:hypothetical protein EC957_003515 [Mortierella hygrophila]|uniref:Uncharacterized protein n=1 Tax=Mortierella hygrophila TaxID=979708 RepID=A0A9P6FFF1_9FUNG|nr:hypothetical protein EC957_003515 [Mortierella hygrophila]
MQTHLISLLLVATAALVNSASNSNGSQGRTLIGDEFTYRTQGDSSHGNTHTTSTTTITRIHKEPSSEAEQWIGEPGLFDRPVTNSPTTIVVSDIKDTPEPRQPLDRRGLLWGGRSTSINNVNDNSQNSRTYNSHDNQSKTITKVVSTAENSIGSRGRHGGEDSWFDMHAEEDKNERVLDHSQSQSRRFLYEFQPNRKRQFQPRHQGGDIGVSSIEKRRTTTLTTTTTAIVDFDDNESKKTVDDIARRNLVTIQIITQNTNTNTNGHSIDTSSHSNHVSPVKVIHRSNKSNNEKKKKKGGSSPPNPRPASKGNTKPIAKSNQYKNHNKTADQSKKSAHATKSMKTSNKPRPRAKHAH